MDMQVVDEKRPLKLNEWMYFGMMHMRMARFIRNKPRHDMTGTSLEGLCSRTTNDHLQSETSIISWKAQVKMVRTIHRNLSLSIQRS